MGLVVGVFNVFFGISYQSYLPALIERADLIEGNSKLEVSRSTAQLAGPAIAGVAIQAIGAARGRSTSTPPPSWSRPPPSG